MKKAFYALVIALSMGTSFANANDASLPKVNTNKTDVITHVKADKNDSFPLLYNTTGPYMKYVACEQKDGDNNCKTKPIFKNVPEVVSNDKINNLIKNKHIIHIWRWHYYEFFKSPSDSYVYFLDDHGNLFKHFFVDIGNMESVLKLAEDNGAHITQYDHWYNFPLHYLMVFSNLFALLLPILMLGWVALILKKFFLSPADVISSENMPSFDEIAGNEYVKNELKNIAEAFKKGEKHPKNELIPSGLLLLGPPGNGKTLMASALAHEINGNFLAINGADFVEMFAGLGPRRVSMTFKKAQKYKNCVIFIDEIDAIGRSREGAGGDSASQEWVNTLNKLLDCIDGIRGKKKKNRFLKFFTTGKTSRVIVIGATNRAEVLDAALTRSGRLEKHIHVPLPDCRTREEIARIHMRKETVAPDFDFGAIARATSGLSGADISFLCKEAKVAFINKQFDTKDGDDKLTAIDMSCFNDALDLKLLGPKNGIVMDEKTLSMTAIHEGGHAFMAIHEFSPEFVRRITIESRGNALGFVAMVPVKDKQSQSLKELRSMLRIQVAGRVAEEIVNGKNNITTGAVGDIKQATQLARNMVMHYGLCPELGMIDISTDNFNNVVSEDTRRLVDTAVRKEIKDAYEYTKTLLQKNIEGLKALKDSLLMIPTQTGNDVASFLDPEDIGQEDVEDITDTGNHIGDAMPGNYNSFERGIIL